MSKSDFNSVVIILGQKIPPCKHYNAVDNN